MISMNKCQKGEVFVMNGYRRGLAAMMAGVFAVAAATPTPVLANKKEAAAVGALIGLAIGAAAASNYKNNDYRRARWDDPFSPHHDILCYPRIGECYKYGQYSAKWTAKIYGY
jgi:hypothetical protein